ncbi:transketolase [Burkholderia sp. WAC0059]|uniref:transketolase n=1 Tax=Burkholderia sp. WAC0059 TaxID=2066022 RepID=UPI000C7EC391|nr:transketolase [Burkholderia sp. WAC0059]PLZ01922.1 transketolase [Burkholderia sp. WAC0059]
MSDSARLAAQFRARVVAMSHRARAAHLASALSCIDIVAVLYESVLNVDPRQPRWADRDRFVLSKGHAAAALYVALAHRGFITRADLDTYGEAGSLLEEHPSPKLPGVEAATGSLGHGLPIGCGFALAGRIQRRAYRTFVLMSDGECNEGSVWEASLFAAANRLGNLCAFVDFNKWQATGRSREVLALDPLADKFRSFGWNVHEIDGHDHEQIRRAVAGVSAAEARPTMVVAHTVKGRGVSFMEDDNNWHYRIPTADEVARAWAELGVEAA